MIKIPLPGPKYQDLPLFHASKPGNFHYARLENSKRLQKLLAFLREHGPVTTRQIIEGTGICAINSAAAELRANGFQVECRFRNRTPEGNAVYVYNLRENGEYRDEERLKNNL